MRYRKDFERKLQKELEAKGHMVLRVAGSGVSSTAHCDLIMFPRDLNLPCLIEVKTTSKDKWVFRWQTDKTKKELQGLKAQAKKYGVRGIIALKFLRKPWIFLDVEKIDKTFRIEKQDSRGDFEFL